MKRLVILFLLLPFYLLAQENISKQVDEFMSSQKDFSAVLLVAHKGKPVYYKAFGYREFAQQIPLQKTDIFELASVSKQFTAMIIMMLKEKGKLGYEDLVEKYLNIPYKDITIRHLLTHTSGLPDYQDIMDKYWDKSKVANNNDILEYLNKYAPPKLFEPGAKYGYSNTGYVLLASIAEKASGKDFIEICRQWIFKPLKMNSANIRTLQEKATTINFAIGHIYVKEKERYIRADSFPSSDYTIWLGNRKGPGRISSTVADLLKWDRALYRNKLVKQTTLQEAFSPMKVSDGSLSYYGFGWMLRSDSISGKVVMHTGSNPGYRTQIIRYTGRNKTIILLCNNAHKNFEQIIKRIEEIICDY